MHILKHTQRIPVLILIIATHEEIHKHIRVLFHIHTHTHVCTHTTKHHTNVNCTSTCLAKHVNQQNY